MWAVAEYAGPCRDLLIAYKERGSTGLAQHLSVALGRSVVAAGVVHRSSRIVVVPMPSARRATRRRGDDVVRLLAVRAAARARRAGLDVRVVAALRQRPGTADSAGLTALQRSANLRGALVVRPSLGSVLKGARVVLADDLVTTGATLAEAARSLRSAGADVVAAATIAATSRRLPA